MLSFAASVPGGEQMPVCEARGVRCPGGGGEKGGGGREACEGRYTSDGRDVLDTAFLHLLPYEEVRCKKSKRNSIYITSVVK